MPVHGHRREPDDARPTTSRRSTSSTEKNPQPNVISCHLGPRAGRASVSTRIRLADTQTVIAIAEMSDGSFWSDSVNVIVTLGACLEDLI